MAGNLKKSYQLPENAVWFITGCSSGIGRALVEHIASRTFNRVVATARNLNSLAYMTSDDGSSPNVLKLALDVSSPAAIDAAIQQTLARFGRIDVVVNNAGYSVAGDTEAISDEAARRLMDVVFWGMVDVTKRVLPVFRDANAKDNGRRGGLILNISSVGGFIGYPSNAFYHASKFAMEGFTQSVAKELPDDWNIHLSLIEPGGVETRFASSLQIADRHPAYENHPASATTAMIGIMQSAEAHKHFAKAADVAAAIYGVAHRGGEIPLRVPLGPDSWFEITKEIETLRAEVAAVKDISLSVGSREQLEMIQAVNASGQ